MLPQVVPTRSAQPATAETGLVIERGDAPIYMVCEATELEHGLMGECLFAGFTLEDGVEEGVSEEQLAG